MLDVVRLQLLAQQRRGLCRVGLGSLGEEVDQQPDRDLYRARDRGAGDAVLRDQPVGEFLPGRRFRRLGLLPRLGPALGVDRRLHGANVPARLQVLPALDRSVRADLRQFRDLIGRQLLPGLGQLVDQLTRASR